MRENYGQMADMGIAYAPYWLGVFPVRLDFSRTGDADR
jgi:hypothetical protein